MKIKFIVEFTVDTPKFDTRQNFTSTDFNALLDWIAIVSLPSA